MVWVAFAFRLSYSAERCKDLIVFQRDPIEIRWIAERPQTRRDAGRNPDR